jgi:glycosyltransferase involved in cell wall biosynthesis
MNITLFRKIVSSLQPPKIASKNDRHPNMKVVHVPFCFYPDPIGGTEVYVAALAAGQRRRGVEALVAAPGSRDESYDYEGLPVRRFAIGADLSLRDLYGLGDHIAAASFERLLDAERPDVVHLHALTSAVSLRLVRAARQHGVSVVFTYHTPTVSCQRGTLLRWGREVCDGALDVRRCTACTLHGLGLARSASVALSLLPARAGRALGKRGRTGGMWTVLRMTELVALRHSAFRSLIEEVDRVVVLCHWTEQLLRYNGVNQDKIILSRHGLNQPAFANSAQQAPRWAIRVAFLGRLDSTKGVDLLIAALRALPDAPVELDIYGIAQEGSTAYSAQLDHMAASDARIRMLLPVPSGQVVGLLAGYDILAVPSRGLETGPLVVLEAFAAGTPVLGSRLGGIAELVTDGVDGLLIQPGSIEAWRETLKRLSIDRGLLTRLKDGVRPPRPMEQVTMEMIELYDSLYPTRRAKRPDAAFLSPIT